MAPLDRYREIRDFSRTPEPPGVEPEPSGAGGDRFVVQEHHATALHWDLRLERDGVLASWAVPRGIPADPRENHLAVRTEDHPLLYLEFEGTIPEGEYGGGLMTIWDRGAYRCEKWDDREVMVVLAGSRARGRYVLFHTRGRDWMIHRMDPPEDPTRELLPADLRPIVPLTGPLPEDAERWSFEALWGGERVVVASQGGRPRATDASGADVTERFPELGALGRALGAMEVGLEGELVVLDEHGRPSPEALRRRARTSSESARRRAAARQPAMFLAEDLVWLEGHSAAPLPFTERRRLLERLELQGEHWQTAPTHPGDGEAMLTAAREQGLPGVVARRLDGPYERDALRLTGARPAGS